MEKIRSIQKTGIILSLTALAFSACANTKTENSNPTQGTVCKVATNEKGQEISQFIPFSDYGARKVANQLCISSGTYYQLTSEAVEKVSESGLYRTSGELAPIFFPSILEHKDLIENAAAKNEIPANVLATLASIESAGLTDAQSPAGAKGLVQVMPSFHFDKFAPYLPDTASYQDFINATKGLPSSVSLNDYNNVFNNPEINLNAGAQFFKECISVAQDANPNLNPDSVVVYGIAAACYNGGAGTARAGYDNMPTESKLYVDHVARILLDVELALKLKEEGYNDSEILKSLKSESMDALAYAYSQEMEKAVDYTEIKSDNLIFSTVNPERLSDTIAYSDVKDNADSYSLGRVAKYTTPMAPGLRIWFASGGKDLFMKSAENLNWQIN